MARDLFWKNAYELVLLAGVGACYDMLTGMPHAKVWKNKFVKGAFTTVGGIITVQHLVAMVSHAKNLKNLSTYFIILMKIILMCLSLSPDDNHCFKLDLFGPVHLPDFRTFFSPISNL